MQGGIWPGTIDTAIYYTRLNLVDRVVVSTWDTEHIGDLSKCKELIEEDRLLFIQSPYPANPGQGNINLQIISSKLGVEHTSHSVVAKTRTDQRISHESIVSMSQFFSERWSEELPCDYMGTIIIRPANGMSDFPISKIFVLGIQQRFPFSVQDHVFWGFREDLVKLFDCPLNDQPVTGAWGKPEWGAHLQRDKGLDFTRHLRMPIYLTASYYARFYLEVQLFLEHYQDYLVDGAPKMAETMKLYGKLHGTLFRPFPRVVIHWEKMGHDYPYTMYEQQGEYNDENRP